jgi:hypothetical protein
VLDLLHLPAFFKRPSDWLLLLPPCKKSHKSASASKTLPQPSPMASTKSHIPKLESETKILPVFLLRDAFFAAQRRFSREIN